MLHVLAPVLDCVVLDVLAPVLDCVLLLRAL